QLVVLRLLAGYRRSRCIALGCAVWAAAWTVTLVAGTLGGGPAGVIAFSSAMVLIGLGETLLSPALAPIVNDLAPEAARGRYHGAYPLAGTIGFVVGRLLAGPPLAAGWGTAYFAGLAIACVATGLVALRLGRRLPAAVNLVGEAVA